MNTLNWIFILLIWLKSCTTQYRHRAITLIWGPHGLRLHPQNPASSLGLNLQAQYSANPYLNRLAQRVEYLQLLLYGNRTASSTRSRSLVGTTDVSPSPPPPVGGLCDQLYITNVARTSGMYNVMLNGRTVSIFCDIQINGNNWLVIQRRIDGTQNFQQNFAQYEQGFGTITAEFFIGLENLADITRNSFYILRVDMQDFAGRSAFAEYSHFRVLGNSTGYRLFVRGYRGNAGDSLTYHSGLPFSTMDRDLDTHFQGKSCSGIHGGGGWWYRSCMISNLNGMYVTGGVEDIRGVVWFTWKRNYESLQTITMRLRAKRS